MRSSQFFITTSKEIPADAEIISHQLMLRAGLVKRLAGGIYTWMPIGLRILRKVENIVREEMNKAGAIELLMPAVQPAELWQESGRFQKYGPELLRFKDRHARDFVIGPTHEEVITDVVRREVKSYKQLPLHLYQVQTKFRDEIRPRFGVMRGREFLMKDGYSFHENFDDLKREYQNMFATYCRIFDRLGLKYRAVSADTGSIGGSGSHEFHVLADSGEDALVFCPHSDYAANRELAEAVFPKEARQNPSETMQKVATPNLSRCEDVAKLLNLPLTQTIKIIALMAKIENEHSEQSDAENSEFILLLLRGDHDLNEIKTQKIIGEFRFASEAEILENLGCKPGFLGPVNINEKIKVIADRSVSTMSDFVCGANEENFHIRGVNFGRDVKEPNQIADIRNALAGDDSPDGKGKLDVCRGIEVGHIFQLRQKYAEALKCSFLDVSGKSQIMEMGCYGIGVSRIVGAAIEQTHDERGMILPAAIAPFEIAIVPMGYHKSNAVKEAANKLHADLLAAGFDVLLDDRNDRPGSLFADIELLGIPHRIVIGERGLAEGKLEYKGRQETEATMITNTEIIALMREKLGQ